LIKIGTFAPKEKCENSITEAAELSRPGIDRVAAALQNAHAGLD